MSESHSFTALDIEVQTALNISGSAHVTINYNLSDSNNSGFTGVLLQVPCDILWRWDNDSSDTIDLENDHFLYANQVHRIDVPIKLAARSGDIYLHLKQMADKPDETIRWSKIR